MSTPAPLSPSLSHNTPAPVPSAKRKDLVSSVASRQKSTAKKSRKVKPTPPTGPPPKNTPLSVPLPEMAGLPPPPPPPPSSAEATPRRRSSVGLKLDLSGIGAASAEKEKEKGKMDDSKERSQGSEWKLVKEGDQDPYYLHGPTGASRWAAAGMEGWMEVPDDASGCTYLENAETGETKWKTAEATNWVEMADPETQEHYWFSTSSKSSQWARPKWVDYICESTGCIYYIDASGDSQWSVPADFAVEAVDDSEPEREEGAGAGEPGAAAQVREGGTRAREKRERES
jgi:hypothetical protein